MQSSANKFEVDRILGKGGEGVVYLAKDPATGGKIIVKSFNKPIQGAISRSLRIYESNVNENNIGLPKIELIESDGLITGIKYPYTPLYPLHWRIFNNIEAAGQALFASFCQKQYYLMSSFGLCLTDPGLCNFLMAEDGVFHYIDFGYSIKSTSHPHVQKFSRLGYGFTLLLSEIFQKDFKSEMISMESYSYDLPCRYCSFKGLDEISEQHLWVKDIVREARSHNATIFLDPAFYKDIAGHYPAHIPFSRAVLLLSNSLTFLAGLKQQIPNPNNKRAG